VLVTGGSADGRKVYDKKKNICSGYSIHEGGRLVKPVACGGAIGGEASSEVVGGYRS
jgi:hypothetical protein